MSYLRDKVMYGCSYSTNFQGFFFSVKEKQCDMSSDKMSAGDLFSCF